MPGEQLHITDGAGHLFSAHLMEEKPRVRLKIKTKEYFPPRQPKVILAVGFIRANRLEMILEKGTELGVSGFYLLNSAHANYFSRNISRWERILRQAIKQSLQYHLPEIQVLDSLEHFIEISRQWSRRYAAIDRGYPSLLATLSGTRFNTRETVCLAIGPEGGFDAAEVALFERNEFRLISLGNMRLRTETAALSGISIIQQYIHQS